MTIDSDANSSGAQAEEFGTIPDYLSAANRERILELSQPNEKEISQVECSEYLIRHWLETTATTRGAVDSRTSLPSPE